MTLTELKYIVAVARERHFGKAADACYVSQPTLSVAVKKLEQELDVKLFERSANEVTVTPLGEEIVRQAQSVLEQAANIKDIARRGKDPLAGPLKLGVIYTIAQYLPPALGRGSNPGNTFPCFSTAGWTVNVPRTHLAPAVSTMLFDVRLCADSAGDRRGVVVVGRPPVVR